MINKKQQMKKERIYLVQIYVDWHNCDADVMFCEAYKDEDTAFQALKKECINFKDFLTNSLNREIADVRDIDNGYVIVTEEDDYITCKIYNTYLNI